MSKASSLYRCLSKTIFSTSDLLNLLNKEILKVKPKANSCLLFPSNFMFPHKVNPVTSGTRYVVVGWMP